MQSNGEYKFTELTNILKYFREDREIKPKKKLKKQQREKRDEDHLECLKISLQAAVSLEFATIPPYLCALWSIKDELDPVAKSIREVVQEEMLHMALVCNMLASLGVTPKINTTTPVYPTVLPGGVHEGLIVKLKGLTRDVLDDFLWIERPVQAFPVENKNPYISTKADDIRVSEGEMEHTQKADETIGELYDEIEKAFYALKPAMSPDNQISGPLAWAVIRNLENVSFAIGVIKNQGEGSKNNPEDTKNDLSHYYRFLEVRNEKKYTWDKEKKILRTDGELVFPDVWPMAEIPKGGYCEKDVSDDVWFHLQSFDEVFTMLMDQLQAAWVTGGQAALIKGYKTMFALQEHAIPLMRTPIPSDPKMNYGPCFRYKYKDNKE